MAEAQDLLENRLLLVVDKQQICKADGRIGGRSGRAEEQHEGYLLDSRRFRKAETAGTSSEYHRQTEDMEVLVQVYCAGEIECIEGVFTT